MSAHGRTVKGIVLNIKEGQNTVIKSDYDNLVMAFENHPEAAYWTFERRHDTSNRMELMIDHAPDSVPPGPYYVVDVAGWIDAFKSMSDGTVFNTSELLAMIKNATIEQ